MDSPFKESYTFYQRLQEATRVIEKYPDRIPIICEKSKTQTNIPEIDKKKYLVPKDLTIGQFIYVIRKRLHMRPDEGLFVFINGKLMATGSCLGEIYKMEHDADKFLYINYARENIFGSL